MNYEELKQKAADIRDETQDAANTAQRVGTLLIEMIEAAENVDNSIEDVQGAIPNAINVSVYDYSMSHEDENVIYSGAIIELKNSAGEVIAKDTLFGAGDVRPGLMSMKKFRQVNAHKEAIAALQQTIKALTARIEALEKGGGGGGSSADVEDGTLSASASVVNDVLSVQGSVKDGILKL